MTAPALFVELCAGTAAVSLKLQGGRHARPPVSRIGAKTGYAEAILRVMGLRCGLGAERYLWCDPDPGVRLLLEAYRDHDLALAAAEIIRGWKDEEPRALWERLRAEGPVKAPEAREVARWCFVQGRGYHGSRWGSSFLPVEHPVNGTNGTSPDCSQRRLTACPTLPATIHPDASQVDPREVARWCWVATRSRQRIPEKGFQVAQSDSAAHDGGPNYQPTTPADRMEALPTLPADIHPDATQIHPSCFPDGERVIAYMDPPYVGTTGYASDLPRAEVVRIARLWADAGADVYISEAEPIPDLLADGWHALDITSTRKGQKRTFSKQQAEWLTCSTEPAWTPGATRQRTLFSLETA